MYRKISILLLCVLLCACNKMPPEQSKTIFAMDTVMNITAYCEDNAPLEAVQRELMRLDTLLARGSEDSEIYRINMSEKTTVSKEMSYILAKAAEMSHMTDGAFDVTVAPVMDAWGFYNRNFRVPDEAEIAANMAWVGHDKLVMEGEVVEKPVDTKIDLGALAKGYASDRAADILKSFGVSSAILSLGGNIYALGKKPDGKPWKVAVQSPFDENSYIGTMSVSDKAVVTSGGYERYFEKDGVIYHHILDPATGRPAQSGLSSVTVVSKNGAQADALSTALFVMGLDRAVALWRKAGDFQAVFVTDAGEIYVTAGLEFESEQEYKVVK